MNKELKKMKKVIKRRKIAKGHNLLLKQKIQNRINKTTGKDKINKNKKKIQNKIKKLNKS